MEFTKYVQLEFEKIHRKMDKLCSMIQSMPGTHHVDLGDWITEEQAQELLERKATSLWGLRKQNKLKFSKIGNRTYYSRVSIIDFIEKNKAK